MINSLVTALHHLALGSSLCRSRLHALGGRHRLALGLGRGLGGHLLHHIGHIAVPYSNLRGRGSEPPRI